MPHIRATCGCWRLLAVLAGIVWRSWVPEFVQRLKLLTDETRARGRGEIGGITQYPSSSSNNATNTARLLGRYDKSKYHYYKRPDGSKQFYRTGQSIFTIQKKKDNKKQNLPWPFTNKNEKPSDSGGFFAINIINGGNQ